MTTDSATIVSTVSATFACEAGHVQRPPFSV